MTLIHNNMHILHIIQYIILTNEKYSDSIN